MVSPGSPLAGFKYSTTPDDNPKHVYADVLVAIDADRGLNNGQPSGLASWIDALDLKSGERVFHIGCGTGYYTALMAHCAMAHERDRMFTSTNESNAPMRALLDRAGWRPAGVVHYLDPGDPELIFVRLRG